MGKLDTHIQKEQGKEVYPLKKAVFYWNTADINRLFCWPGQQKQSLNTFQIHIKTNNDGYFCYYKLQNNKEAQDLSPKLRKRSLILGHKLIYRRFFVT